MPFPRRLLTSDEKIVLDTRPHWIAIVVPALVTILLIAALAFGLLTIKPGGSGKAILRWILVAVVLVLFVAYPLRRFIQRLEPRWHEQPACSRDDRARANPAAIGCDCQVRDTTHEIAIAELDERLADCCGDVRTQGFERCGRCL